MIKRSERRCVHGARYRTAAEKFVPAIESKPSKRNDHAVLSTVDHGSGSWPISKNGCRCRHPDGGDTSTTIRRSRCRQNSPNRLPSKGRGRKRRRTSKRANAVLRDCPDQGQSVRILPNVRRHVPDDDQEDRALDQSQHARADERAGGHGIRHVDYPGHLQANRAGLEFLVRASADYARRRANGLTPKRAKWPKRALRAAISKCVLCAGPSLDLMPEDAFPSIRRSYCTFVEITSRSSDRTLGILVREPDHSAGIQLNRTFGNYLRFPFPLLFRRDRTRSSASSIKLQSISPYGVRPPRSFRNSGQSV